MLHSIFECVEGGRGDNYARKTCSHHRYFQSANSLIHVRGATALLVAVATPRLPRRSEANYRNSFQLTHMPRGSVDREQWRPKGRQDSTHNLASTVSFGI